MRSSSVIGNSTFCACPAFSITFLKLRSSFTGRLTEAVTSCRYNCTTVAPSYLPVFLSVTLAVTLPLRAIVGLESFRSERLKLV
ncbi:hypothetical protein D3C78_1629420 [compost metagenome]